MSVRFQRQARILDKTPIPSPSSSTEDISGIETSLRPVPRPERSTGLMRSLRPVARPDNLGSSAASAATSANTEGGDTDPECMTGLCPTCSLITAKQLSTIFTSANDQSLKDLAKGLNYNITDGKIDTHMRISHFLGQVREEVGAGISTRESLYYTSAERLKAVFSYLRRNPKIAEELVTIQGREAREEAIANIVYMDVNRSPNYRLGNTEPGDGWRYRGRGLKQLTGRDNYRNFTIGHSEIWGGDLDFEAEPDKVAEPIYSVRSGLWYWVSRGCHTLADGGITRSVSENVTDQINRGIGDDSRTNRWNFTNEIYSNEEFAKTCWNKSWVNANSQARLPAAGGAR